MFGRADILLEKVVKNLTIPSSCLIDRNGKGDGAVMVVTDGKIHRASVKIGMDTGLRAEIVRGLANNAQVVLQPDPSIADGTRSTSSRSMCRPPRARRTRGIDTGDPRLESSRISLEGG